MLVYNVDLVLLLLVGIFILLRLPRALALLGSTKEWRCGHFLRHVSTRVGFTTGGIYPIVLGSTSKEGFKGDGWSSDDSHFPYSRPQHSQRFDEKGLPVADNVPPHIAACPRLLRPFLKLLRMRVSPGFSVGQFIIIAVYFAFVAYASFFHSDLITDQTRTGWVATAQLPFVFAFAQKNNLIGSFLGYGYEKV